MGKQDVDGDKYGLDEFSVELKERRLREERDEARAQLAKNEREREESERARAREEDRKVVLGAVDGMRADIDALRVDVDAVADLRGAMNGLRASIKELAAIETTTQGLRTATAKKAVEAELAVRRMTSAIASIEARLDGMDRPASPRIVATGADAGGAGDSRPVIAPASPAARPMREPATLLSVATLFLLLLLEVARRM